MLNFQVLTVHEVTRTKLSGPKNFTPYDFCLCTCMQSHKRRESAFSLKVIFRCFFFYFQLPYWCTILVHQCIGLHISRNFIVIQYILNHYKVA